MQDLAFPMYLNKTGIYVVVQYTYILSFRVGEVGGWIRRVKMKQDNLVDPSVQYPSNYVYPNLTKWFQAELMLLLGRGFPPTSTRSDISNKYTSQAPS